MKRKNLEKLLLAIEKAIVVAQRRYDEVKHASDHMQKTAAGSWSAAGDREYAKGQEEINKFKLDSLVKLRNEIKSGLINEIPKIVMSPCYIKYSDGTNETEAYFVENTSNMSGFKLISTTSPIGKAIVGKSVGDKFGIGGSEVSSKITDIG